MVKSYANKMTTYLVDNKKIENNDYELYSYAFEVLISSIGNFIIILIIGALFNRFTETLLFLVFYCPIRQFAGGFHAESYTKCLLFFLSIYIANILIIDKLIRLEVTTPILALAFISYIGMLFLVPQEHRYNPLSIEEKKKYKEIVKYLSTILLVISIIGINLSLTYEYGIYLSSVIIWIFIMLILGLIKKEVRKFYEKDV
ncbi:accessory gene regulator B family protein [Clostridioides mangenotii]|uniref:accessory gene regulator ArgB-like protein n=1 Tax=Metaclostridioides mangenotii TaxID=1540 RepID=UPI002149AE28|nr:accessory gene regulator B family protein [Clostridioides mangenotii]MCR1954715.1 accessory gene regulator B family protein [Clostridioides mangenotii]